MYIAVLELGIYKLKRCLVDVVWIVARNMPWLYWVVVLSTLVEIVVSVFIKFLVCSFGGEPIIAISESEYLYL